MGFVQTRGIEELKRLEGIHGGKISETDIQYLTKFAQTNGVLSFVTSSHPVDFSKPKSFFVTQQTKLVFLKNGKVVPYCAVDVDNQDFIAYQRKNQKLYVYGYFAEDYDWFSFELSIWNLEYQLQSAQRQR